MEVGAHKTEHSNTTSRHQFHHLEEHIYAINATVNDS